MKNMSQCLRMSDCPETLQEARMIINDQCDLLTNALAAIREVKRIVRESKENGELGDTLRENLTKALSPRKGSE